MKLEVEVACGPVKQVFEVEANPEDVDRKFDVVGGAGIQTLLTALMAGGGVKELRTDGFKVKRVRYESPYPGGYVGPERVVTECDDSSFTGTPTTPGSAGPG